MDTQKLKQNLQGLHPLTRIIKLTDLIKKTEDKKLKEELTKLLEQTHKEIEHQNTFNLGALPQQTTQTIEETQRSQLVKNLEQVIIQEAPNTGKEETGDASYTLSSTNYDTGYEKQRDLNYEREREHKEETTMSSKPLSFREQFTTESEEKTKYKTEASDKNGTGY